MQAPMGNKPGTLKIYMSLDNILKVKFGRYTYFYMQNFVLQLKYMII